ncbi:IS3 family transposase, partial [Escherichia coli]|nr:IS3 family transposase [Escherichia coli]
MQHVDVYIRWYNAQRIKLSLGTVSPEIYRQQCGLSSPENRPHPH